MEEIAQRVQNQEAMIQRMQGVINQQVEEARRSAAAMEEMRQQLRQGAQVQQAIQQLPQQLAEAVRDNRPQRLLVDNRGLGKPGMFSNRDEDFLTWTRKTANYVSSVFPNSKTIMGLAADAAAGPGIAVDTAALAEEALDIEPEEAMELDRQLYAALMTLTEGDGFDVVIGSGDGRGLDAWRRLHKRYDPLTQNKSRGLLKEVLQPPRSKIDDLLASLERHEELVRRYCNRRGPDGARRELPEDVRMASVECLLPEELEKHVQLNRARLDDYPKLREEIVMYVEARTGSRAPRKKADNQWQYSPMDVDSLMRDGKGKGKGKGDKGGKGKGKGKGDPKGKVGKAADEKRCHICGRKGHLMADCWYRDQKPLKPSPGGGKGDGKGKGKGDGKGKGKGKAVGSLDTWTEEPESEVQAALELCAVQELSAAGPEDSEWLKMNLDTGSAGTVFPMEQEGGEELRGEDGPTYKTATGELIDSGPSLRMSGRNEWGQALTIRGRKAPVHKPLLSGGEVAEKNDVFLWGDGGWIISHQSKAGARIREAVGRILGETGYSGVTPVYKERNVYNVYIRKGQKEKSRWCKPADMCPADEGGGSGPTTGGRRQVRP